MSVKCGRRDRDCQRKSRNREPFDSARNAAATEGGAGWGSRHPSPASARGTFHLPPAADKTTSIGYATKMTSARRPCWVLFFFVLLVNSKRATCPGWPTA